MATVTKKKTTKKKKVVAKKEESIDFYKDNNENDPRRKLFEAYYTNPESPTFSNIKRSSLKAGYSMHYANNLSVHNPQWFADIVGRMYATKMVIKARENLEEDLNMEVVEQVIGPYGPIFLKDEHGAKTIPVMARNIKAVEARQKATFFVSERVDSLFNKTKKDENNVIVDFKQVIIINPNGSNTA